MKFSFLLPSKDRLEYLRYAVDSVLRQAYEDVEIIISDNASGQDYAGFVNEIGDPRIIYRRLDNPVPVTENWNAALSLAHGDYVLMLGDDDALTPWFVERVLKAMSMHGYPDIVFMASYHYCYPGVIPGRPNGYLADVRNSILFEGKKAPFPLSLDEAKRVAKAIFDFRYLFGFNSQHFLFSAKFLSHLERFGSIFQSPYPDTFAAAVSFLNARSIVVIPEPTVIIGISPKSFGYYYFNDRVSEGYQFLDADDVSKDVREDLLREVLPGDRNNTNWLIAAEVARRALQREFDMQVSRRRYRILQMAAFLRDVYVKRVRSPATIPEITSNLSITEFIVFTVMRVTLLIAASGGRHRVSRAMEFIDGKLQQFYKATVVEIDLGPHSNMADVFKFLSRRAHDGAETH